ncbi:hypothetical protein GRI42_05195 [Erythrobacter gaetbuli]|uniref:Uncharacterized protein n=1 Tax=Qipengyuania gaetbuli TaxID=266952 RepID=A0A844XZE7_9SPHN|nr:hypothetical protein [Qipengyuania gaetbuli]MXO50699.1 hypothetical protein [Qipengyuania gaetbuli]
MTRASLKKWRLAVPVFIFLSFQSIAAENLGLPALAAPKSFESALFNLPALLTVLAYSALPLRKWTNHGYHKEIKGNIRKIIFEIIGEPDDGKTPESKIMNIFYRQIDRDKTLEVKSEIIMSNGFIWTSLADLSVISIIFSLFSFFTYYFGIFDSGQIYILFATIGIASLLLQSVVTKKHVKLSTEQLEYMRDYRSAEIKADFEKARR